MCPKPSALAQELYFERACLFQDDFRCYFFLKLQRLFSSFFCYSLQRLAEEYKELCNGLEVVLYFA